MKYHVISTSKSGHGAIFTNGREAADYMKQHPDSTYTVFDKIPIKIPAKISITTENDKGPVKSAIENLTHVSSTSENSIRENSIITIYTDGSAIGNPGPGGYGAIIIKDDETVELAQGFLHTTNNRMEMMAVITALETLEKTTSSIKIFSDSQYTINGIVKGWAKNWRKKGWKKGDGKPALNSDLWQKMLDIVEKFPKLSFQWVRGHAGDPMNERADRLANSAAHNSGLLEDIGYKG